MDDASTFDRPDSRPFRDGAGEQVSRREDRREARRPAPAAAPAPPVAKADPVPPARAKRRWLRPALLALLPLALAAGIWEYVTGGQIMATENAYVRADLVGVSTDVSGIVQAVEVRDNQKVVAGDVLFRLDDEQFRLALARADAQLGIVRNDLQVLEARYRDIEHQIGQAQADVDYYTTLFNRQRQLLSNNFASQAAFDESRHNLDGAAQKLASLKEQLAGTAASLNGDPDAPVEAHPRYQDAQAMRDEAARQLAHATVRAPMSGVVTNVPSLQPGQYLAASTPAFSIVATDNVWIETSPKETELTYVRPGQPVRVTVDTYPGESWRGTVESISPASAASFSLLPAQNTTGNWVKVVQRIPMRVRIATPADKPPLRVGMSVEAEVDTGHARGLPTFVARLFGPAAAAAHE